MGEEALKIITNALPSSDWAKLTGLAVAGIFALALKGKFDGLPAWASSTIETRRRLHQVSSSCHAWVLYPHSLHSQCSLCDAYISTGLLLQAKTLLESSSEAMPEQRPNIIAQALSVRLNRPAGSVMTSDWVGKQPKQ